MTYWNFRDFVSPAGNNQIARWYGKELSTQTQSDFDRFLNFLKKTKQWQMPTDFKLLSGGKLKGLSEIRFWSANKQYRVIGYANGNDYILLIGCFHKSQIYTPTDARDQALKRRKQIISGEAHTVEHEEIPETKD